MKYNVHAIAQCMMFVRAPGYGSCRVRGALRHIFVQTEDEPKAAALVGLDNWIKDYVQFQIIHNNHLDELFHYIKSIRIISSKPVIKKLTLTQQIDPQDISIEI